MIFAAPSRPRSTALQWYDAGHDWKLTRGLILRNYGHADCTNLYQNIGFVLLALLYGGEDFRETIRLGLACGYDTDCICATAASVLGIIRGAKRLLGEDGMSDSGLAIGVGTNRKSGSIATLARDVCAVGISAGNWFAGEAAEIAGHPECRPVPAISRTPAVAVEAVYQGDPVLRPDAPTELSLAFTNHSAASIALAVEVRAPEGVLFTPGEIQLTLQPHERYLLPCRAELLPSAKILCQQNLFQVHMRGAFGELCDRFGLVGCDVWYRFGPFLENIRDISTLPPHEAYGSHLALRPGENAYDITREYHLGGIANIDKEFVSEAEPFLSIPMDGRAECIPERIALGEDLFDTAKIQKYEGAHVDYLVRTLVSPEERSLEIAVGHTAPFKLWLNGKLLGESKQTKWWTLENMHFSATLARGENTLILKCAQQSDHAKYSIVWRDASWRQYADFASVLLDR